MLFRSRLVSFVLALSIALVTTAFISLIPSASYLILFVAFSISFSSSFLLFYFTLEFLVLGEVNEAYAILEKFKKKDFKIAKKQLNHTLSPIKKLNYEIYAYAANKQKEIDHLKKLALYRREFLADVSHELKTPIFAAQGFLHTLIDGAIDDESVRYKFLNKAAKSLDGLQTLVEDLFTLSKMEVGMITMRFEEFDIREIAEEVFEQLEEQAQSKKIELILSTEASKPYAVLGDEQRIRQVLMNLINNAIKYGFEEGFVKVNLSHANENQKVKVIVEDNGPGIPPEHLDRIFERFYRVEKSRSKSKGGSGLGLAIVKHILEAHESEIKVNSKVKKGSKFTFCLEAAQAKTTQPEQATHKQNNKEGKNDQESSNLIEVK